MVSCLSSERWEASSRGDSVHEPPHLELLDRFSTKPTPVLEELQELQVSKTYPGWPFRIQMDREVLPRPKVDLIFWHGVREHPIHVA